MQAKCCKCDKDFNDKVGMGPMESNLAIRYRNKIGNICPDCQAEIRKTKQGRRQMFFYNLKVALYCARFLLVVLVFFALLTVGISFML